MAKDCGITTGANIFAQQLFLGASITNFSSNLGWGGSVSSLNVDLVNDFGTLGSCNITNDPDLDIFNLSDPSAYDTDNHFYNCVGNSCYSDENGNLYDPDRSINGEMPPSKEKRIPGKLYHIIRSGTSNIVSRYWRKHDPGFFGAGTLIDPAGAYNPRRDNNNNLLPYKYNIIGVPVMFRYGYFTFGGIITSWDATINGLPVGVSSYDIFNSSVSYRVNISSADTLLEHSKVILDNYSGAIFSSLANTIGGPTNYTGSLGNYVGLLKNGNIPNVFNVYGFLESFGFGTANKNQNGIPLTYILDALTVLTSTAAPLGFKHAFSPFGRIIAPIPLTDSLLEADTEYYGKPTYANFGENSFGILNQETDRSGVPRIRLALDLSEIPRPSLDVRIETGQSVMSILDLIRIACDKTNRDFYTTIVPKNGINFIKIKTINRGVVVPVNKIEDTVKSITDSGLPVTQSSFGQNDNRVNPRVMLIGANQQRLYQVKSFLLGYSNTHLVYHPVLKKFVDYYRFGKKTTDSNTDSDQNNNENNPSNEGSNGTEGETPSSKASPNDPIRLTIKSTDKFVDTLKIPLAYSTRNINLCRSVNGNLLTEIWANEQSITPHPDTPDPGFSDKPVGGSAIPNIGNYYPAAIYKMASLDDPKGPKKTKSERIRSPGDAESGAESGSGDSEEKTKKEEAKTELKNKSGKSNAIDAPNPRYLPLYKYAISPFFGYAHDLKIPENAGPYTNRFVRPVYFDTVTGQIIVLCRGDELPILTLGRLFDLFRDRPKAVDTTTMQVPGVEGPADGAGNAPDGGTIPDSDQPENPDPPPVSPTPTITGRIPGGDPGDLDSIRDAMDSGGRSLSFGITESEIRAAMAGMDSYLAYCLQKLDFAKPDLFLMLIRAYKLKGKSIYKDRPEVPLEKTTNMVNNTVAGREDSVGTANVGDQSVGVGKTTGNIQKSSYKDILNINFSYLIDYDFYNDLTRIVSFIKTIGEKYYGKKYAVSLPSVTIYKDKQYAGFQIQAGADSVGVYQGSGKLFYSYEISQEGAWEEFGNMIDDCIMIGGPNYFNFVEDNNLIKPIIGYNATPVKDYATEAWCSLNSEQKKEAMKKAASGANVPRGVFDDVGSPRTCSIIKKSYELSALARYFSCDKSMTASLDIGKLSNSDNYILIYTGDAGREDAYGNRLLGNKLDPCGIIPETVTIPTEKLYIKTDCDPDIVFYDPINLQLPKAIINSPGVDLAISSTSYKEDPNMTVISTVASEDLALIEYFGKYGSPEYVKDLIGKSLDMKLDPNIPGPPDDELLEYGVLDSERLENNIYFDTWDSFVSAINGTDEDKKSEAILRFTKYLLIKSIVPITSDKFLIPASSASAQSSNHFMMEPKKANPTFAAIPIRDNLACYGPWTNYPSLGDSSIIFPGITKVDHLIEQLISDTDIDKRDEWAPWNYGGMAFLDNVIFNEILSRISYQTRSESGEFSIAGLPVFSMGGNLTIRQTDQNLHNKVIKNWFSFPYHSLIFADSYSQYNNYSGLTMSDIRLSVGGGNISTSYSFRTYSVKRGLYSKENADRLKHLSLNSLSVSRKLTDLRRTVDINVRKQISEIFDKRREGGSAGKDITNLKSGLYDTSPSTLIIGKAKHYLPLGSYKAPSETSSQTDSNRNTLVRQKSRFDSWAGLFKPREALNELTFNYSSQAGMSFDGLYSPVSFYPTSKQGTYAISSRCITSGDKIRGITCPGCNNNFTISLPAGSVSSAGISANFACPLCSKSKILPYSGIIDTTNVEDATPPIINFLSLNPIVMPTGEFKNPNAQPSSSGERSRHNISFIVRDENHIVDRDILVNENLTSYKDNLDSPHPDWTDIDVSYKKDNNTSILNNHRFFALRGPLMLHGWGYDKDGYPVPNAADEPIELDNLGRPKRFFLTTSGTNDYTKDGDFIPTTEKPLGDIIGKGWSKDDGTWKRKPSNKFYLNWAERPDIWPIGPVDLRWDDENKIWIGGGDGGCSNIDPPYIIASGTNTSILSQFIKTKKSESKCSYKMIYGILEQDLIKIENHLETQPARAFLDDLEYGLKPLPQNIRRLIYIVDRTGYTAPRGAKLLLRYNTDTGFYEPVSKQQYIVFGILNTNGSAVVELAYMPGYKSGDLTYRTTIQYNNPLNLQMSSTNSIQANTVRKGAFMYDNSQWNLIAIG